MVLRDFLMFVLSYADGATEARWLHCIASLPVPVSINRLQFHDPQVFKHAYQTLALYPWEFLWLRRLSFGTVSLKHNNSVIEKSEVINFDS